MIPVNALSPLLDAVENRLLDFGRKLIEGNGQVDAKLLLRYVVT